MATRRIGTQEKTLLEKDDHHELSPPASQNSNIAPAVPLHVIVKLLAFTFAMIILPISSYFISVRHIFVDNATYSGALAAIMANVVLVFYVIVAMNEDDSDAIDKKEGKKAQ